MWTARCIAFLHTGRVCLEPAEYLDPLRRGLVCGEHRPEAGCPGRRQERLNAEREAAANGLVDSLIELPIALFTEP